MTALLDAARQALEAMACCRDMVAHPDNLEFIDQKITALRQAIEQAEQAQQYVMENAQGDLERISLVQTGVGIGKPEQEPVAIKWTLDGEKNCGYNNWLGETPFGRILITWKDWKEPIDACVDDFPGGFFAYGNVDEVKAECEAEFLRRLCATPPQRQWVGLTDEEREFLLHQASRFYDTNAQLLSFIKTVEAKLKEKNT